jgi:hypothetical protein
MRSVWLTMAIVALAAASGCTGSDKKGDAKDGKSAANAKPSVSVDAVTYAKDVAKGGADAKKYAGTIELEGKVAFFNDRPEGGEIVLWAGPNPTDQVLVRVADKKPWESVLIGQSIKAVGAVPEMNIVIGALNDAKIVHKGAAPPTVASEALAAEFTKDDKAAAKKYADGVVITGTVEKKDGHNLTLKGDGKTSIETHVLFGEEAKKKSDAVKVGDAVKVTVGKSQVLPGTVIFANTQFLEK